MIDLSPWVQRELRWRYALVTAVFMLSVGCGVLGYGWWNAESDKDVMQAEKDKILTLYTWVATMVDETQDSVSVLQDGISDEGFVLTVDDRMYWDNVYRSLAMSDPGRPTDEEG